MAGRRAGWWVAGAILSVLIAIGVWISSVFAQAQSELDRHARSVEEGSPALRSRNVTRPVVIGEPIDGDAWEFYGPPFKLLKERCTEEAWDGIFQVKKQRKSNNVTSQQAAVREILALARGMIGSLGDGLRRTRVNPGFAVGDDYRHYQQRLETAESGLRLISALIPQDHSAGNDDFALELATVVIAVAQDLKRGGSLEGANIGVSIEADVLNECRKIFEGGNPSVATLRMLAERLASLERPEMDFRDLWRSEDLLRRNGLLSLDVFTSPYGEERIRPGWRCFYSTRIMKAQILALDEMGYRRMVNAASSSLREQKAVADQFDRETQGHPNPIAWLYLDFDCHAAKVFTVPWHMKHEVENQVHRTIFRTAVALALYEADQGKAPGRLDELVPRYLPRIPECAYTGRPLGYAPARLWSVGLNERDDGGVSPEVSERDEWEIYTGGDKDIVWKLGRGK